MTNLYNSAERHTSGMPITRIRNGRFGCEAGPMKAESIGTITEKPAVAVISDWPGHAPNGKYGLELSDSMVLQRVW